MEQCDYPVPRSRSFQENTLVPHYLIRLFYVEHAQNYAKLLILLFLSAGLISCNKRDPNPENKETVYLQLQKDLGEAKAALVYVQDYINTNKNDLEKAVPQSGERAVYEKRVNEGLNAQLYANQQVRMYEIRIEERKIYAQRRYLESLTKNGRKWPEEGEAEAELQKLQLLREKVARVRDTLPKEPKEKDVPRGTQEGKATEKPAEKSGSASH